MKTEIIIPESDVLIATTLFLIERGVKPYQFSVAAGRGINSVDTKNHLHDAFATIGRSPQFSGNGADILAISKTEWWSIECKGAGFGKRQTQRNNFDRALASVVSYYEERPSGFPYEFANATVCLGLALPDTRPYLNELRRRVRSPLRKRLNLWVLLYNQETKAINPIEPEESL